LRERERKRDSGFEIGVIEIRTCSTKKKKINLLDKTSITAQFLHRITQAAKRQTRQSLPTFSSILGGLKLYKHEFEPH
jgi:hypothetical protein